MSSLYPDVIACLSIQILEIKKMVYLYLINYARVKPEMVVHAMDGFLSVCPGILLMLSSTSAIKLFTDHIPPQLFRTPMIKTP